MTVDVREREDVLRRWRQGEERLYPVVTVQPESYEGAIRCVRALVDALAPVPDIDALVTTYGQSSLEDDLRLASLEPLDIPVGVDPQYVRDSAYQFRSRELAQREAEERTDRVIERALRSGERTVILWAHGEDERWPPYRRVEMSLSTGFAVATSTEFDADTMMPVHTLEAFQLDPETGAATDAESVSARREFGDVDAWRAATAELRAALLQIHEEDPDAPA